MKVLYRGRIIEVGLDTFTLPDGRVLEGEKVHHPGGAAAVAVEEGKVCLIRQYRYAVGGWLWEIPAGKLEPGEPPLVTAQRELDEEAGLQAGSWHPLGTIHPSPGVCDEAIHLFFARELTHLPRHPKPYEVMEVHWRPLEEALSWAASGIISDAKTIIGLFRAARLMPSPGSGPG